MGSRALEILGIFVRLAGEVVGKQGPIGHVQPEAVERGKQCCAAPMGFDPGSRTSQTGTPLGYSTRDAELGAAHLTSLEEG